MCGEFSESGSGVPILLKRRQQLEAENLVAEKVKQKKHREK